MKEQNQLLEARERCERELRLQAVRLNHQSQEILRNMRGAGDTRRLNAALQAIFAAVRIGSDGNTVAMSELEADYQRIAVQSALARDRTKVAVVTNPADDSDSQRKNCLAELLDQVCHTARDAMRLIETKEDLAVIAKGIIEPEEPDEADPTEERPC